MTTFKRSKGREPGTYWPAMRSDRTWTASLVCPSCQQRFSIENHTVDPSGKVSPSVVCVRDLVECPNRRCEFHDHVMLDGWVP